jgi:ethanolamine utilization microcompartment shell protein EutS
VRDVEHVGKAALFASKNPDVKLSTLNKIAGALGADLQVSKVDAGLDAEQSSHLIARLRRVRLAERLAAKSGLDASDIEHALFNLTLTPSERLARKLWRGRSISNRC